MNTRWKNSKTVQTIIIVKSALLIALWISMDRFHIGDKPSLAQDGANKVQETRKNDEKNDAKTSGDDRTATTEKRRSFLDNLLNLPDLDVSTLKREEVSRFLTLADRKKKQVDERLEMLKTRETQLTKIEQSIDEKLKRLDDERRFFAQTVQQEKELKGQRLDRLVELYDKMEPKKAAPVVEQMDKDLVVALFKRLKQKQVTTLIEFMKPDKSVELTEYFGRVRSGREYDLLREMNVSLRKEFAECKGMGAPEELDGDTEPVKQGTAPAESGKKAAESTDPSADEKVAVTPKETSENDIQPVAPVPISVGPVIATDSLRTLPSPSTTTTTETDVR